MQAVLQERMGELRGIAPMHDEPLVAVGLVVFQEVRSERALAALRELAQPNARVIRGGEQKRDAARDLVVQPGAADMGVPFAEAA